MAENSGELQDRIRERAYYLWLNESGSGECDFDVWRRAELIERSQTNLEAEAPRPEMGGSIEFAAPESSDVRDGTAPNSGIPTPPVGRLTNLLTELERKATYFCGFQSDAPRFHCGKGIVARDASDATGAEYRAIAHDDAKPQSADRTEGYCVRVPDELERAASGNLVIVKIIARTTAGGSSRFGVIYTTAEVGNSGWRWFSTDSEWAEYSMEYEVPPMIVGNGDYVHIQPDTGGKAGIDLACIAVEVIPKSPAK